MKIYLLDRNVVATIKQKNAGKEILSERDRALRRLDKEDNLVSPILSIIEGQTGTRESNQQYQETLAAETEAISKLFKRARTDSNFLQKKSSEFSEIFTSNIELKWENYISFTKKIQSILYQPISKGERKNFRLKILEISEKYNIPSTHPAVICSLSVLYGCEETRRILKPKLNRTDEQRNKDAYNAMSDLIIISRLHMIQNINSEDKRHNDRIIYFTFDKGLEFFLKSI